MKLLRVSLLLLAQLSFSFASSSSQLGNPSAPRPFSLYERLKAKEAEIKAAKQAEEEAKLAGSKRKRDVIDLTIDTTFSDLEDDEPIIFKQGYPRKRRLTFLDTSSDESEEEEYYIKLNKTFRPKRRLTFLDTSSDDESEGEYINIDKEFRPRQYAWFFGSSSEGSASAESDESEEYFEDEQDSAVRRHSPISHVSSSAVIIDFDPNLQQVNESAVTDTTAETATSPLELSKEERFCNAIKKADWNALSASLQSSVYEFEQSEAVLNAIKELLLKNDSEQARQLFALYPRFRMLKSVVEVVLKAGSVELLAKLLHPDDNITASFLQEIKSLFSSDAEYSNFLWQMMLFGNDSLAVIQAYVASADSFAEQNFFALSTKQLEAVIAEAVRNNSFDLIDAIASEMGAEPFDRQTYQSRNYRGNAFVHLHYNSGMARKLVELGVDLNTPVIEVNTGAKETLLTYIYRQGEPRTLMYLRHSFKAFTMETLNAASEEAKAAGNGELERIVGRMIYDLKHKK